MSSLKADIKTEIETEIDRTSFADFLALVAEVCYEKACICRKCGGGDSHTSNEWMKAGDATICVVNRVNV